MLPEILAILARIMPPCDAAPWVATPAACCYVDEPQWGPLVVRVTGHERDGTPYGQGAGLLMGDDAEVYLSECGSWVVR